MQRVFIGRQAIFDRDLEVYAYELLYREGRTSAAPVIGGDQASSRVILNTFTELGLERLVGRHLAFINLTRSFFVDLPPVAFSKDRVVLELLEDTAIDDRLLAGLSKLSNQGYTLALDDFEFESKWAPVLPFISIVKVEVPNIHWPSLQPKIEALRGAGLRLLAEKVETEAEYRRLLELKFDYFQGYYFSRPQVLSGKRLGENQLVNLQLLARLSDPAVTPGELESLIAQDPGLTYKILRYLNSAALNLPRKINTIGQAVVYLGLQRLRSWASLIALSGIANKPQDLFTTALVRAHMCGLLAAAGHPDEQGSAFTAGLLSVLDRLLDQPLQQIVQDLPLTAEVNAALLKYRGISGQALSCAISYENQLWEQVAFPGLNDDSIQDIYLQSSQLAFQQQEALLG